MEQNSENAAALLVEQLKTLEHEIRKSITLREDQEDDAELQHRQEAERCGISVDGLHTKADLLNAVQTAVRAAQAKQIKGGSHA